MKPPPRANFWRDDKPLGALLAFFVPLLIFWTTLAPTVTLEDSGEYISVAETLGLAHPPGAPLWCLLGHAATNFPLGSVAQRTGFLSTLCGAAASLFLFLFLRRIGLRWEVCLSAGWFAVFARTAWGQSVVTEIYSLNLAMLFLCFYLAQRWRDSGEARWLYATALAGGLGACNHHLLILLSPWVIAWTIYGRVREVFQPRRVLFSLGFLILGLSVYLYLPLRSALNPPIAWGRIDSLQTFVDYFTRKIYKEAEGGIWYLGTLSDAWSFFLAFFQNLPRELGGATVLLAIPGLGFLARKHPGLCAVLVGMIFFNVPLLLLLGRADFTPTSEYINRFYYLPANAAIAVMIVYGWNCLLETLSRCGWTPLTRPRIRQALVLGIALFPLGLNWHACDRSDYLLAQEYGENLIRSLPAEGAVLPLTNNEAFVLAYFRFVRDNPRAWLLDNRFGWDGKKQPKAIFTAWDVGQSAAHPLAEILGDRETLPDSILYRVANAPYSDELEACRKVREIDYRIEDGPEAFPDMSPFERMIFASYSAYYARLGGRYWLEGNPDRARKAWTRAEELNPPDSFCHYLLGRIYELSGAADPEKIARHYRQALELFPLCWDPLDTRFYSVTEEKLREAFDRVELSSR